MTGGSVGTTVSLIGSGVFDRYFKIKDSNGFVQDDWRISIGYVGSKGTRLLQVITLNQPFEKTHTIMSKWGYTGSACIPMVLHEAIEHGKLKRGNVFVLCASGGGINMAAMVFRY